jgi:hypothetical protein
MESRRNDLLESVSEQTSKIVRIHGAQSMGQVGHRPSCAGSFGATMWPCDDQPSSRATPHIIATPSDPGCSR